MDAADVDDAAEAAFAHARQHGAGQAGHADQHHLHEEVPLFDGEVLQRRHMLQAGVVDQHVDGARDRRERGIDAVLGGDVQRDGFCRTTVGADLRRDRLGGRQVEVADDDVAARFGKLGRDAGADTAGRAGDEEGVGLLHGGSCVLRLG